MFVDKNYYRKVFYESIKTTFSPAVKKICDYYRRALENSDEVIITAKDGTDLKFSIKGRPILVADGMINEKDVERGDVGLNIPDGEVFVAPLENSAEGYIIFDFVPLIIFIMSRCELALFFPWYAPVLLPMAMWMLPKIFSSTIVSRQQHWKNSRKLYKYCCIIFW
jgi:hypothetical protein